MTYFYWANAGGCSASTCDAYVGVATSTNGGATWSQHQTLAGPMHPSWWAQTEYGLMTGDYISTSIAADRAVSVVPVATAPTGTTLHQAMYGGSVRVTGGSIPCETLSSLGITPKSVPAAGGSGKNYHTSS